MFNLTQNLRFSVRPGSIYYIKTEVNSTAEIQTIRFGTTDLVIKGPGFGEVYSQITPANQASQENNVSRTDIGGARGFNNNSMSAG